jgi:hypothetical protein
MISFDSNGSRTLHHMGDDDAFLTIELSTNVKRMHVRVRMLDLLIRAQGFFFFFFNYSIQYGRRPGKWRIIRTEISSIRKEI